MLRQQPWPVFAAMAVFLALTTASLAQSTNHGAFPGPEHGPADVVRIQVQALANNDAPYRNAGIEIAFRFASPANKRVTGPLRRFIRLLYDPTYRPFLNHKVAHFGQVDIQGSEATQTVILTAVNGQRVGYVFRLSKQRGAPCKACWMTDGVWRINLQEA